MRSDVRASAVIIGAGIVGNAMAWHLSKLGWRDMVLVDKGPLPNPGGSTGHASNFCFPVDGTKEESTCTVESIRQFTDLGVFTRCGGMEVARTPDRMAELARRQGMATSWGIESRLLSPSEVHEIIPYLDPSVILAAGTRPPRAWWTRCAQERSCAKRLWRRAP